MNTAPYSSYERRISRKSFETLTLVTCLYVKTNETNCGVINSECHTSSNYFALRHIAYSNNRNTSPTIKEII